MSQYYVVNEEFNKFDLKSNNYSFDIKTIIYFIINNYKQILLLLLVFIIIYVVDHITYYNMLFYGLITSTPGTTIPNQPREIKSNTFKKKSKKNQK